MCYTNKPFPCIYCNVDWYKNVLDTKTLNYNYWLAAYPSNDNGSVQERLKPSAGIGWQYSSKGSVDGIAGHIDMDMFYTDYKLDKTNNSTEQKTAATKSTYEKCAELMAWLVCILLWKFYLKKPLQSL